jgi:prevent-host-death family protein
MIESKRHQPSPTTLGAYEAKTKFSELIARAEKGETFVVTKNGRPVARITPMAPFDRERARQAAARMRAMLAAQGPRVSEAEAQRNWEDLKADIEREHDERLNRWLKS